jgi:hypothetical protein
MPLKGEAKKEYEREYKRKKRGMTKGMTENVVPSHTACHTRIKELEIEVEALRAEVVTLKKLLASRSAEPRVVQRLPKGSLYCSPFSKEVQATGRMGRV